MRGVLKTFTQARVLHTYLAQCRFH